MGNSQTVVSYLTRGISILSQSIKKAEYINVIGAGLAGSEAAYQIAKRGIPVKLYEMRGVKPTPQHLNCLP